MLKNTTIAQVESDSSSVELRQDSVEVDMRRIMFKSTPELSDGETPCTFDSVESLCDSIKEWAANFSEAHNAGESFSVELVAITNQEFEALPTI